MARSESSSFVEVPPLIYRLCAKESNLPSDTVSHLYSVTLNLLGSQQNPSFDETDEFYIMEKIKKKLAKEMKDTDALRVEELYYKLKRMGCVKNPGALLMFLFAMAAHDEPNGKPPDSLHLLNNGGASLPFNAHSLHGFANTSAKGSSSMFSQYSATLSCRPFGPDLAKLLPTVDPSVLTNTFMNSHSSPTKAQHMLRRGLGGKQPRPHSVHGLTTEGPHDVSEIELMREVLFAFQGLNGRILIQDPSKDNRYKVNPKYNLSPSTREFALRLSNIGWLFTKVNRFCQQVSKDPGNGHVCQSFAAALNEEVLEYYRLITVIEQQLHFGSTRSEPSDPPLVSLHRLQIWSFDSFYRLKMLALLVESCKHKRGGSLANVVHCYLQHGDPQLKSCLARILNQVVLPIRRMLSQWIFHGEVEDNYKEFFISSHSGAVSPGDTLWHEKYSINKSMLPGFISMEQAKKVLATGKAINLLLEVCGDQTTAVPGYDDLKKSFESSNVDLLFKERASSGEKGEFQRLLDVAYKETSQQGLKILFEDYKFMNHLGGLRQFMLLGQGDFIRHLMDLLVPELDKQAHKLQTHSLNSLLNSAIRATNAQFLDEDVISRVDIRLLDRSLEETGWDIFTLAYQTKGPIGTILTARCMQRYSTLFKHLWRSKRMEYVLSSLWKNQMSSFRFVKIIPRLKQLFHLSYTLLAEMMHFIQQMQYYIEFEVMECSWAELIRRIEEAKDIDQLVEAHERFLAIVISRSMVDEDSQCLSEQLRAIYDLIIQFQNIQEAMSKAVDLEMEARTLFNKIVVVKRGEAPRVTSESDRKTEDERKHVFETDTIPNILVKVRMLAFTYQDMVQKFLLLLADHQDLDLRFLSFRLDFNEHYKKRNKSLETSFTYSKHRLSIDTSK